MTTIFAIIGVAACLIIAAAITMCAVTFWLLMRGGS